MREARRHDAAHSLDPGVVDEVIADWVRAAHRDGKGFQPTVSESPGARPPNARDRGKVQRAGAAQVILTPIGEFLPAPFTPDGDRGNG